MKKNPPFRLAVPASTSNLGPGFDLLGLALELELRVDVRAVGRARLQRRGTLATLSTPPEDDLVLRGIREVFKRAGAPPPLLDLVLDSTIPVARGLGSSGAALAAGLFAGNLLLGADRSPDDLAAIGAGIEGHPENVAASLLGGLVAGAPLEGGGWRFLRPEANSSLRVAVAWPDVEVPTALARAALPKTILFAIARENPRNFALLLEGLKTLDPDLLRSGLRDGLHVPFRSPFIPRYEKVVAAAQAAGALGATISGSGSAVVALCANPPVAEKAARAMVEAFRGAGKKAEGRALGVARRGARLLG